MYVLFAAIVYVFVRRQDRVTRHVQIVLHATDLVVPVALNVIIAHPVDVANTLYLVPLVGASMRWGDSRHSVVTPFAARSPSGRRGR